MEFAATSDWKVSAGMALVCVIAASVVIPALFGSSRILAGVVPLLSMVGWLLAFAFGGISLVRYLKKARDAASGSELGGTSDRGRAGAVEVPSTQSELSDVDKALAVKTFAPRQDAEEEAPLPPVPEMWSREVIDRMEWKRFEDLCCAFYRVKGIRAETTRLGADGGVDIRLYQDEHDPQRCTAIVQCKAWNQQVGVKPVRELRGVMAHEKVEKAFFMAPNGFTRDATDFAAANRITLLDGRLFLAMLQRLPEAPRQELLAFATEGDWTTPTCPACGAKLTAREGKRGRFWGCVDFPRCRGMLPMRATAEV